MSEDNGLRSEIIMRSAELRLDLAIREAKRQLWGDEVYEAELAESDRIDRQMRREPAPEPNPKLPGWKRHRWAAKLRGG